MVTRTIKNKVKSTPFLYRMLLPSVMLIRKAKWRARARRELPFRLFCLNLSKVLAEPVFVKVGANDGITGDPCSDILLANNWKGLLIEPVPYCFERLKVNFPDAERFRLEQVAIGEVAGEATCYYVDARKAAQSIPRLPPWVDGLGSFDRNNIVKQLDGMLEPFIVECKVQVCTLSEVLERNRIQDVHLLHVDAEGHDYKVLKSLDFVRHAPLSIFIEHEHLVREQKTQMLQLLRKHGYSVRDCGVDYFAINEKLEKGLERLLPGTPAARLN
jgi:FkbM family methyltransferase